MLTVLISRSLIMRNVQQSSLKTYFVVVCGAVVLLSWCIHSNGVGGIIYTCTENPSYIIRMGKLKIKRRCVYFEHKFESTACEMNETQFKDAVSDRRGEGNGETRKETERRGERPKARKRRKCG